MIHALWFEGRYQLWRIHSRNYCGHAYARNSDQLNSSVLFLFDAALTRSTRCSEKDFFFLSRKNQIHLPKRTVSRMSQIKKGEGFVLFGFASGEEIENPAVLLSLGVEKDLLPIRKVVGGNHHQLNYCRRETRHRTKVESTRNMKILYVQVISFYQGQL